jgi:hypothetical protein
MNAIQSQDAARSSRRPWRRLCLGSLVGLATLLAIEGGASLLLLTWDLLQNAQRPLPERKHTTWDAELGWTSLRGARVNDLYGPGRHLSTNALGARGQADCQPHPAAGKRRLICSGDSFTLGYGVSDEHTYPHLLAELAPEYEVVNLGQGGYGLDQAYLWYLRSAQALEHHVHFLAFIADDFERMRSARFQGYGKPLLLPVEDVAAGQSGLELHGVPVPKRSFRSPWWTQNERLFAHLRGLELMRRATGKLGLARAVDRLDEVRATAVAERIFSDLAARHAAAGRRFALVFLPNLDPHSSEHLARPAHWMTSALERARARGIEIIDLRADFERLVPAERARLFLPKGLLSFPGAAGHYSEEGNALVAQLLARHLGRD